MKIWTFLLSISLLYSVSARSQRDTSQSLMRTVFMVRPGQYVGALAKIKVDANGQKITLVNASYAVLKYRADSVVVRIDNRRLSGESVQPLVSYKDTTYFVVFPEEHAHRKDRLILTEVERDSYEKYAEKVTRQVKP
jgi:hypothetical protein